MKSTSSLLSAPSTAEPAGPSSPAEPPEQKLSAYPGAMSGARRLTRAELEKLRKETREASVQLKRELEARD